MLTAGVAAGLADPHKGPYFVAEEDGRSPRPDCMITFEWSDWRNGWIWWIQSVYVRADARRRGIFRALYEHVYEAARADPEVIGLRLYVEHDNHGRPGDLQRLGMTQTGYWCSSAARCSRSDVTSMEHG